MSYGPSRPDGAVALRAISAGTRPTNCVAIRRTIRYQVRALLPERALHRPCQRVHRGTAVARLTYLGLQQNVFPPPGLEEAPTIRAGLLFAPRRVGARD